MKSCGSGRDCFGYRETPLKLFIELAGGAGNEDPPGDAALPVFYPLYDTRRLAALGTIRALGCVHHLLTVCCLRNLCRHSLISLGLYRRNVSFQNQS